MLTGTWASEDEEDSDLVVVKCGGRGRGLSGGGVAVRMVSEVEGVSDLVNDGRHGNGCNEVYGCVQGSLWRGGTRGWSC